MDRPQITDAPSLWHMRIWDAENNEWLGSRNEDDLPYYGFDIRGGEVTCMQSMDWVYSQIVHGKKLIWELSTGLCDKNGVEIYGGDVVKDRFGEVSLVGINPAGVYLRAELDGYNRYYKDYDYVFFNIEVVGSIHDEKYKNLKEDYES